MTIPKIIGVPLVFYNSKQDIIMAGQYEVLPCPFCHQGKINCLYFQSATSVKVKNTATFGRNIKRSKSAEVWIIKSGCEQCSKSADEVEERLKKEGFI